MDEFICDNVLLNGFPCLLYINGYEVPLLFRITFEDNAKSKVPNNTKEIFLI